MKFQSNSYLLPIPILLLAGYFVGIYFPIVIHYHDYLDGFLLGSSKNYAIAFLLGVLGSTTQLSIDFARTVNTRVLKPKEYSIPTLYDPLGYLLKQIWGGITAVVFILFIKQGFVAAFEQKGPMELEAMIVIAFGVGLNCYSILKYVAEEFLKRFTKKPKPVVPPENSATTTPKTKDATVVNKKKNKKKD